MQRDDNGGAPASDAERALNAGEDKAVSLLDDDSQDVLDDDASEGDDGVGEEADAGDGGDKPRRRSRSHRYREPIARLTAELEAERRRSQGPASPPAARDDLVEPRPADFPNDTAAYDRALRDFQIRQAVRDELRREADLQAKADAAAAFSERLAAYQERVAELRPRIVDFDEVMDNMRGSEIRNDVRDLILGSAKGPLLAYYLAKHRDELDDINRMPPAEAARRVGNLEARIRGPNPAATRARAPVVPPRGGASAPRALDAERMSHADYRKARAEGRL